MIHILKEKEFKKIIDKKLREITPNERCEWIPEKKGYFKGIILEPYAKFKKRDIKYIGDELILYNEAHQFPVDIVFPNRGVRERLRNEMIDFNQIIVDSNGFYVYSITNKTVSWIESYIPEIRYECGVWLPNFGKSGYLEVNHPDKESNCLVTKTLDYVLFRLQLGDYKPEQITDIVSIIPLDEILIRYLEESLQELGYKKELTHPEPL